MATFVRGMAPNIQTSLHSRTRDTRKHHENSAIVWLDTVFSASFTSFGSELEELGNFVGQIYTFCELNECVSFINEVSDIKVLLLATIHLGKQIVPIVHHLFQISSIYLLCIDNEAHALWTDGFKKIRGIYKSVSSIHDLLKRDIQCIDYNLTPISIYLPRSPLTDHDTLDPSFMYCQVLKEIFIDMDHGIGAKQKLVELCNKEYATNLVALRLIDEFNRDYEKHSPVWWYTRDCFIYRMLNKALRIHQIEIINKFGFFIKDLHQQLQELQKNLGSESFTVYRGQSVINEEFDHLKNNVGGLLSFNNFLSTSVDEEIARGFALPLLDDPNVKAILFFITVDPRISTSPMALVEELSFITQEKEVLLDMSTVFRIVQVNQEESGLWCVRLSLTSDNDPQLSQLTAHLREEVQGTLGLDRLGQMMAAMDEWDKANDLYQEVLNCTNEVDKEGLAHIHHMLGYIASGQNNHTLALENYNLSVIYRQQLNIVDDPLLVKTYSNMGVQYREIGDFDQALEYFQRAHKILSKKSNPNQQTIATLYNNMAGVYQGQDRLDEALENFGIALAMFLQCLPPTHSHLATMYNNIAFIYATKKDYPKSIDNYRQCLYIEERSLLPNHPSLANTHRMLTANLYYIGEYKDALSHAQKAFEIARASMPPHHPQLQDDANFCSFLKTLINAPT